MAVCLAPAEALSGMPRLGLMAVLISCLAPPAEAVSVMPAWPPATAAKLSPMLGLAGLGAALGGTGKAKLVWSALRAGLDPWTDESVTPMARALLARDFEALPIEAARSVSRDGTVKLLVRLQDGLQVETVVIPFAGRRTGHNAVAARTTLCVSSQVNRV